MRAATSRMVRSGWLAVLALSALIGGACAAAPVLPASPHAWRAAAQADIEAAVQVTRENHPGAVDPHNPAFLANLEAARRHGLALAARVVDAPGYVAAIQGFNVRIGDGHAGLCSRLGDQCGRRTAGRASSPSGAATRYMCIPVRPAALPWAASCSAATARTPIGSSATTSSVSRGA